MGKRIGYARVSTDDQNLDLQRDALALAGCSTVYEETMSGKSADRPELGHCLKALRSGDTLVVWRLDRLGRSLPDLVGIVSSLEREGVAFESITERIETTSAAGKLIFHVFAALAEFERNLIRERTRAGLAAARARGTRGPAGAGSQGDRRIRGDRWPRAAGRDAARLLAVATAALPAAGRCARERLRHEAGHAAPAVPGVPASPG